MITFFDLPLRQRLFLAMIPGTLLLLPSPSDAVVQYAYPTLFGLLVMAPFITARSMLAVRLGVLVATAIFVIFIALLAMTGELPAAFDIHPYLSMRDTSHNVADALFDLLELALLLSSLPALILFLAGPLKVSWKYWIYTFLSGLVTAAAFFAWIEWFYCMVFCSWWDWASIFLPFSVWSLSFCIAVYYGRTQARGTT